MKLAIYAISKNEEENVDRFMDSVGDIPVYVLDHSTDGTAEALRARGAIVDTTPIEPFRFDVAKNYALEMTPKDTEWCLNLDLDESLTSSAGHLKRCVDGIPDLFTIARHFYKPDHEIERVRHECRLHRRDAYRWNLPIHEHLVLQPCVKENVICIDGSTSGIMLTQYPSRDRIHTWSKRLLDAVEQYPKESRLRMLAGRDLFFDDEYEEAVKQFEAFVTLEKFTLTSQFDLAYVYSMLGKCWNKLGNARKAFVCFEKACDQGKRRESFVDLAHACMLRGMNDECLANARRALRITDGEYAPHSDPGAWSYKPHEMIAIAQYNLGGKLTDAIRSAEIALSLASGEDAKRIAENLKTMRSWL